MKTLLFAAALLSSSVAFATGPVYPNVRFTYTAEDIRNVCAQTVARAGRRLDRLARIPNDQRTFQNTVVGLERTANAVEEAAGPILFLAETSPSSTVQEAAHECADSISSLYVQISTRADLFRAVQTVADRNLRLDLEDAKLLQETLRNFRRNGASLEESQRAEVARLKERLSIVQNQFSQNLARANDTAELSRAELEGLSDEFISGLQTTTRGTYLLTLLDASSYIPFLENARNAEARRKVVTARDRVAASVNVPLLEEAIALRHRIARLLGFENHAAYVLDAKMAQTPARVLEFLEDLSLKLRPKAQADLAALLERKRQDDPSAERIEMWDWRYYANQLKKERYSVDDEEVRQYFPVDHVISSVLEIYQNILGVRFVEVAPAYAWAPDVRLFEVRDRALDTLIGHFYLDLFPRENKYKHFAAFDFIHGRRNADGSYHTPISSVVGNFPRPTSGRPALLSHDDVETFFHEFGHIMQQTLTTARYSSLSGTNVRGDYVEAPSQMLENWAWDRSILARVSHHYQTGASLPDDLLQRMLNAKHFNEGITWSRQLFFATVDMRYHTMGETVNTTQVWNELSPQIFLMNVTEGAQAQATFGHLMGGYDAGYYGYLWSKVYAQDMFTVFEREGLESPSAGARYRHWILEPGGTQEPDALIRGFLGREPNKDAFYRSLGIDPHASGPGGLF